jgi:GxxExxY protein
MKYEQLSGEIIGAAMRVANELKPGLREKIYENALVVDLREQGHNVDQQTPYPVHYHGVLVGQLVPDLVVDGRIIVDPKVVSEFTDSNLAQMLGYLAITGLELGILFNFKEVKLRWKRVVRSAHDTANLPAEHN